MGIEESVFRDLFVLGISQSILPRLRFNLLGTVANNVRGCADCVMKL